MKSIFFLALALLAATQVFLVAGAAVDIPSLQSANDLPYPFVIGTVSGEVNGVKYSINGTIGSVLMDLKKQYPNLKPSDFLGTASGDHFNTSGPYSTLQKRNKIWPPLCFYDGYRWKTTNSKWVYGMAESLEADDRRTFGVPGRSCGYIDCNRDAQMLLCNDRDDYIAPSVRYLASYVRDACGYDSCKYHSLMYGWQCGGQVFDTDNYNVIVRRREPNDKNVCLKDVPLQW